MYHGGMTVKQVSEHLSSDAWQDYWTRTTGREYRPCKGVVEAVLRNAGVEFRSASVRAIDKHPAKKPWPTQEMISWYQSGMSLQEIADRLCSHEWQAYWIERTGTEYRPHQKIVNKHLKRHIQLRGRGAPLERNGFWNGGRVVDKGGYQLLKTPTHPLATASGYVREHRLVMEQKIGRLLTPDEVVHHKDDDPSNNSPLNLELYESNADHISATTPGKRKYRHSFAYLRRMALSRSTSLLKSHDEFLRRLYVDHKLSLYQVSHLLCLHRQTARRHLLRIGAFELRSTPGVVTDAIREECRLFLANLKTLAGDAPS